MAMQYHHPCYQTDIQRIYLRTICSAWWDCPLSRYLDCYRWCNTVCLLVADGLKYSRVWCEGDGQGTVRITPQGFVFRTQVTKAFYYQLTLRIYLTYRLYRKSYMHWWFRHLYGFSIDYIFNVSMYKQCVIVPIFSQFIVSEIHFSMAISDVVINFSVLWLLYWKRQLCRINSNIYSECT